MSYSLITKLANPTYYGSCRPIEQNQYITVHWSNCLDENPNYLEDHIKRATAHYLVKDTSVTRLIPDNYISYSVGLGSRNLELDWGGGTFYGKCTNSNSISVELYDILVNDKLLFSDDTLESAATLIANLMTTYHIQITHVIRHFDVTGKECPRPFVENEEMWKSFKELIEQKALLGNNPQVIDDPSIISIQKWMNTHYHTDLELTGNYTSDMKKALIKLIQSELGVQKSGKFIQNNKLACPILDLKSSGILVTLWQCVLYCKGFDIGNITGKYDQNTKLAQKKLETAFGLTINGTVEPIDWYTILK